MITKEQIELGAKAMLERQNAPSTTKIRWEDLREKSKVGYREDARVCLESALGIEL